MKQDIIDDVFIRVRNLSQNVDEARLLKEEKEIRLIYGGERHYIGSLERKEKRLALQAAIAELNRGASLAIVCAKYKISAPFIRKNRNKMTLK